MKKGKEFVALEKHVCVLCDELYDTGAILMSTRLTRPIKYLDHQTVTRGDELEGTLPEEPITGMGVCDTCKKDFSGLSLEDYNHIALVEVDPDKMTLMEKRWADRDKPDAVDITKPIQRTGKVGFVSRSVWAELFNTDVPPKGLCFVEPGVIEHLAEVPGAQVVDDASE